MRDYLGHTLISLRDNVKFYGLRAEHCWNGGPAKPNWYSRLHYDQMYLPQVMERIGKAAPPGADLTSWRY